jgi:hypothetical protein
MKTGPKQYACSKERQLSGTKVVKVVLYPLFFLIMDILFVVFLVVQLKKRQPLCGKENAVSILCIKVIALSWPLFLSPSAHFGVYSGFLAVLVAFMSTRDGFPWWSYRLVWAMQVFQVVLLFGPNEAFHVPIFNQSLAGKNSDLITGLIALTEEKCDAHYESFFKLLSIEKEAKDADPDTDYWGYCTPGWLGVVQGTLMLQGIVWMVTVLLSAPVFLTDQTREAKSNVVLPFVAPEKPAAKPAEDVNSSFAVAKPVDEDEAN